MVKSENSERVKISKSGVDRISNLPEHLISHILSLLETKYAVATSVLSTRWKLRWTSITNLDLDCDEIGSFSKKELRMKRKKFTHFVNRVLLLLNPPSIQTFRLSCYEDHFDPSYLDSWVSVALGRTIRELDLILMLSEPMELPLSHIYCNVVVLKLKGNIHFNIPAATSVCLHSLQTLYLYEIIFGIASTSSVSFPNLKNLRLDCVKYMNEDSVHRLFSSCPVLDELVIKRDEREEWDELCVLILRIPSLTSLTLCFRGAGFGGMPKLLIDTPALQYLNLDDELPCEYLVVENLSSLLKAEIDLNIRYADDLNEDACINIFNFIGSLSRVKSLSLLGYALMALRTAPANILPGFHNLTFWELEVQDCRDLSIMINNFLESMDNLEHLVLKGWGDGCSHPSRWTEPVNVPKCLLSRVTTITFNDTTVDCCDQLELLRYFLKNAEVLQLLTISLNRFHISEKRERELVKKISMVPRASRTCQVAFN